MKLFRDDEKCDVGFAERETSSDSPLALPFKTIGAGWVVSREVNKAGHLPYALARWCTILQTLRHQSLKGFRIRAAPCYIPYWASAPRRYKIFREADSIRRSPISQTAELVKRNLAEAHSLLGNRRRRVLTNSESICRAEAPTSTDAHHVRICRASKRRFREMHDVIGIISPPKTVRSEKYISCGVKPKNKAAPVG